MEHIIVTRHKAFAEYVIEQGLAPEGTPVYAHVSPSDIKGKHLVGFLPLHLALQAERITIVPFDVPKDLRGKEIEKETFEKLTKKPQTFEVKQIETSYFV